MSAVAKILARVADQYGTGVYYLARRPAVYAAPLSRAEIEPEDITPENVARAAAIERAWWDSILDRVRKINEKICYENRRVADNYSKGRETNPNNKGANMVRAKRSEIVAIFIGLGYGSAEKWDEKKLGLMLADFHKLADDETPPTDKAAKKLFNDLVKAAAAGEEVDVLPDGKGGKTATAVADPSDDPSDDDPSDDDPSDDDDFAAAVDPSDDPSDDEDNDPSDSPSDDSPEPEPAPKKEKKAPETKPVPAEEFVGIRELVAELKIISGLLHTLMITICTTAGAAIAKKEKAAEKPAEEKPAAAPAAETNGGGKLSDVIDYIAKTMKGRTKEKALSTAQIVEKLSKKFPDREEAWLKEKLGVQLGGRLEAKFGIAVKKTPDKKYYAG